MKLETWKPIKGYEGLYEVSNHGRVRSLDHEQLQLSRYGTMMVKRFKGREIKPHDNSNGYQYVTLHDMNKKNHYVHRLVAEAFVDNPNCYPNINHKDYNKSNNSADNLEWITQKANVRYSSNHMVKPKNICKSTVTGEKYITVRNGKFRFSICNKKVQFDSEYGTIDEAIQKRNLVLADAQYLAR